MLIQEKIKCKRAKKTLDLYVQKIFSNFKK